MDFSFNFFFLITQWVFWVQKTTSVFFLRSHKYVYHSLPLTLSSISFLHNIVAWSSFGLFSLDMECNAKHIMKQDIAKEGTEMKKGNKTYFFCIYLVQLQFVFNLCWLGWQNQRQTIISLVRLSFAWNIISLRHQYVLLAPEPNTELNEAD